MTSKASFSTRLPTTLIHKIKAGASNSKMTIADYVEQRLSSIEENSLSTSQWHEKVDELVLGKPKDNRELEVLMDAQRKIIFLLENQFGQMSSYQQEIKEVQEKLNHLKISVEVPNNSHSAQLLDIVIKLNDFINFCKNQLLNLKINTIFIVFTIVSTTLMYFIYSYLS